MAQTSSGTTGGVSTLGLLGIVFVTLKLLGYIDWSWWWVTAPFWGPLAIVLAIFSIIGIFMLVVFLVGGSFIAGAKRLRGNAQDSVKPKK